MSKSHDDLYWNKIPSKILKAELTKRGINYPELASRLHDMNIQISVDDLRGRFSRGTFSAKFFIQCLKAIGVANLPIEDSYFQP